nr:hypothetical protein [Candidatus Njordarchaeum guaymaensis]
MYLKGFELFVFAALCLLVYLGIERAKRKPPEVRPFPALEHIDEAVGRAAEMGRPVHFSTGLGGLHDEWAPVTTAGLAIMGEVAKACGKYRVPMRYTTVLSYLVPIAEDLIKFGYDTAGHVELYNPDMVVYTGEEQRAMMSAMMGYIMREKPAVNMLFGATKYETINFLGTGAIAGCMQFGGTPRLYYLPVMMVTCDYCLLGEEVYAAGAAVTKEPSQLGSIKGIDHFKIFVLGWMIVSLILALAGLDWFGKLIKM